LSGDNKLFFVANNLDGTVTQINAAEGTVAKTLTVRAKPVSVATWGEEEGPSHSFGPLE
jgi:DNA-binding beta-propeller fold protein YncE